MGRAGVWRWLDGLELDDRVTRLHCQCNTFGILDKDHVCFGPVMHCLHAVFDELAFRVINAGTLQALLLEILAKCPCLHRLATTLNTNNMKDFRHGYLHYCEIEIAVLIAA